MLGNQPRHVARLAGLRPSASPSSCSVIRAGTAMFDDVLSSVPSPIAAVLCVPGLGYSWLGGADGWACRGGRVSRMRTQSELPGPSALSPGGEKLRDPEFANRP